MGCICSYESDHPIKCTQTFDLQSGSNINPDEHTITNNLNQRHTNLDYHNNNNNNSNSNTHNSRNSNSPYFYGIDEYVQRLLEPHLQSLHNSSFNFKSLDDTYSGEGLKRMKAYISPISKEELEKKRQFFWETRIEGSQTTWTILRSLCEDNEIQNGSLQEYLFNLGIIPYKNCINITYDITGSFYEIPNYCINDPVKYIIVNNEKTKPNESNITVKIRNNIDQFPITISNYALIDTLKDEVIKVLQQQYTSNSISKQQLCLYFGGKELLNDKELWYFNVINNVVIILLVRNGI